MLVMVRIICKSILEGNLGLTLYCTARLQPRKSAACLKQRNPRNFTCYSGVVCWNGEKCEVGRVRLCIQQI